MRGKRLRGSQQTQKVRCPYCGKRFADVLRHLNHRESKCTSWFTSSSPPTHTALSPLPDFTDDTDGVLPPPFIADPELPEYAIPNQAHPESPHMEFSTAGKIFGSTKSFIDRFHDDKYASYRVQNPYYPFADQEEWELGSFLLGSGMSMQKVDEFLKLKLVFCFRAPSYFTC